MSMMIACAITAVLTIATIAPLQPAAERWAYQRDREK